MYRVLMVVLIVLMSANVFATERDQDRKPASAQQPVFSAPQLKGALNTEEPEWTRTSEGAPQWRLSRPGEFQLQTPILGEQVIYRSQDWLKR